MDFEFIQNYHTFKKIEMNFVTCRNAPNSIKLINNV